MRPRSLRGWHWRLIHVAVPLFLLGFGFILGWLLVRLPDKNHDEVMPAPAWLLWTGILLCLAALAVWALALFTAPLYDPEIPSDNLGPPMGPVAKAVLLRWMPLSRTGRLRDRVVGERLPGGSSVLCGAGGHHGRGLRQIRQRIAADQCGLKPAGKNRVVMVTPGRMSPR